jgi:hypothetical protein
MGMKTVTWRTRTVGTLLIPILTLVSNVLAQSAPTACQPQITGITLVQLAPSGSGYSEAGPLGSLTVGDLFSLKIVVTNSGAAAVNVGNPYSWSFEAGGTGHVDLVGQPCACASLVPLQPGQSATLTPFCCQAFKATAAGQVTFDIALGSCTWSIDLPIDDGGITPVCEPELTRVEIIKYQPSGLGFKSVGQVGDVTVGDFFTVNLVFTNLGGTPVATSGNLYSYAFSGSGKADVVTAEPGACATGPGTLQPGQSMTMIPFCSGTAFQAVSAGAVTMNVSANGCTPAVTFEIKPGSTTPSAAQPKVTGVRIVQLHPAGSDFTRGSGVSDVNVGDFFTIELGLTNTGSAPVSMISPYSWTLSGSGAADVFALRQLACAALVQLQPGGTATLPPFCGGQALLARTAGFVTLNVSLGANGSYSFPFLVRKAAVSPVLFLPFNEGAGVTANDLSGHRNPGTIAGAAWIAGHSGYALNFNGNAHVTVPEIPAYDVTSAATVMGWVRTTANQPWGRILDKSQYPTNGFDLCVSPDSGLPRFEFFAGGATLSVTGTTRVTDGQWHFVVGTFGGRTLRLYVDGTKESEAASPADIATNDGAVMIGGIASSGGGQPFSGLIDEPALYDRCLTADQVLAVCTNGVTGPVVAPALYLPLNEGAGATAEDLSGYHNAGTVVGAAWVPGRSGTALAFTGGSHVAVPDIPAYDVTGAVSALAWVRTTANQPWGRILDKSEYPASGFDLCLSPDSGLAWFEFFVAGTVSTVAGTSRVTDGQWHLVAGTFGNRKLRIYVDGRKEGETTTLLDILPNNRPIWIGAMASSNGGQPYSGTIDEPALYDCELSADQIQAIFLNGMP